MTSPIENLVHYARQHAPFYAALYRDLPASGWQLQDLPLIDPADYWQQSVPLSSWPVLTGAIVDGHVFKTGGSTGDGKLSVYTRAEWHNFVSAFGRALSTRLHPGDRVANLFFAGDLYTSFLFIHSALAQSPVPVCEFPFTGAMDLAALAQAIATHQINVLACVPAQLMRFASHLAATKQMLPSVTTVLYGGESLFAEQISVLKQTFPNAIFASVGCASVDAGLVGASTPDCALGEHRVFDGDTLVEIVDDTSGQPIDAIGQNGILVVTNLQRRLMPLIRYPTGDLAAWCEPAGSPQRKFALRGRASQGHRVRVGTLSLFPSEIGTIVQQQFGPIPWQMAVGLADGMDQLTLRIACSEDADAAATDRLRATLLTRYPQIAACIQLGQLRLNVDCCPVGSLSLHPRSGKLLRVVDQRDYAAQPEQPA
ncbi:phenylacetate--CoA ligase family protein [Paraherbaspirillum soli]|uniref:Phenylacetate--CoA ligase family protein n=1 Tax=Paraherbaspirillum soli TaxID=631222 RepID=A0ABW0MCR6_9BURK